MSGLTVPKQSQCLFVYSKIPMMTGQVLKWSVVHFHINRRESQTIWKRQHVKCNCKAKQWTITWIIITTFTCTHTKVRQCSSTFLPSWNPWYTFLFVMEPPLTKIGKARILVRKSNISLLDTSTSKQLLLMLKSKEFNDCCSCIAGMYLLHSEFGKKNSYLKYVSSHFLTWQLNYIRPAWD